MPDSSEAQNFRDPAIRVSPTSITHPEALRSKFDHAEALMGQMKRVQREQAATSGFAEQAYQAQQAYLAQLAYDEYQQYVEVMKKEQAQEEANGRNGRNSKASYVPPANRPSQYQPPSGYSASVDSASRYAPPVHIPPAVVQRARVPQAGSRPATMSFGDAPAMQPRQQQYMAVPASRTTNLQPRPVQAQPRPDQQVQLRTQVQAQPAPAPVQRSYGNPLPQNHQQIGVRPNQSPIGTGTMGQVRSAPQRERQVAAPTPVGGRPYILSENSVGLQDKIASLLSKPGYRGTKAPSGNRQNLSSGSSARNGVQLASSSTAAAYPKRKAGPAYQSVGRTDAKPKQPLYAPERVARAPRRDPEFQEYSVSQADRQGPIHRFQPNAKPVRQVSMVEPVQDPFNDFSVAPIQTAMVQEAAPTPPVLNKPMSDVPRIARQTQEFRQISVLRGRQEAGQESGDFDSQFRPNSNEQMPSPTEDNAQQDPFGIDKDEDIKRIDDDLNRQLQELDRERNNLRRNDDQEKNRLDKEIDDLEKEMDKEIADSSSVMDDEDMDDRSSSRPTQKSCEEFRTQLLNSSIRDIALDISPPASSNRNQFVAISRSWTDRSGMVVATGSMVDLRRGYVIIEGVGGRLKIPYGKLSDADLAAISEYWQLPEVCTVGGMETPTRNWVPQTYTWQATNACHKPLYFENIQLERYGHTHGPIVQPFHSAAHFFVRLATLPYHTAIHPPNECEYSLGLYRPGNCAPWLKDPIPFSLDGIRRQATFVTGLSLAP